MFGCYVLSQIPVIDALTSQPQKMTNELQLDDLTIAASAQITRRAAEIGVRFRAVFLSFADVHQAINHSNPISQSEMERTGRTT